MADLNLTQGEADRLLAMEKQAADGRDWLFPGPGERISVPLTSLDSRESFHLDVTRFQIRLTKATFQNRARVVVVLSRLDVGGALHRNPDGEEIPCPHIHIYREGFGDKWAVPAPMFAFPDTSDLAGTLEAFMKYCHIVVPPRIQRGLFS